MGEASQQRWNHDQIPEMGSLDRLSRIFLTRKCRVRRRRVPVLGYRNPHQAGSILHEKIKPFGNCHAISHGFSRLPRPTSVTAKTQKISMSSMRIFLVEG